VNWNITIMNRITREEAFIIKGAGQPPSMTKWDGRNNKGEVCGPGVYDCILEIELKNGDKFRSGTFTEVDNYFSKTLILNLNSVEFKYGQSFIDKNTRQKLSDIASTINKYPTSKAQVRGFAILGGNITQSQCLEMSLDRACKVADLLIKSGVPTERLSVLGFGNDYEGASKQTGEIVEIWLIGG
jgi:outer membrane protein OmpA-like peptidoglycan-associated protein